MKTALARAACLAAIVAFGTVAFAQNTAQTPPPAQQPPAAESQPAMADQVTITGCVQKEADYRAANNLGAGGAAGTGAGVDNEYVLVNATITSPAGAAVGTSGSEKPEAAAAPAPKAFELTGSNEGKVGEFVGKHVEIIGKLKAAEMGAAGATGGTTAGAPPAGIDVASKDLKLREVEVTSVRETPGTCPAK